MTIKRWTGEHQATGAMEYQTSISRTTTKSMQKSSVLTNKETLTSNSACSLNSSAHKTNHATPSVASRNSPSASSTKTMAVRVHRLQAAPHGAKPNGRKESVSSSWRCTPPAGSIWSLAQTVGETTNGNVDIAAYPSVKATVETMRETCDWLRRRKAHSSTWMSTGISHSQCTTSPSASSTNTVGELYMRMEKSDFQMTSRSCTTRAGDRSTEPPAIKITAQERCNKSVIDQVTISGSPAESDAGGTLDALRKQNSVLDERCKTQQLILEQNAEQIQVTAT